MGGDTTCNDPAGSVVLPQRALPLGSLWVTTSRRCGGSAGHHRCARAGVSPVADGRRIGPGSPPQSRYKITPIRRKAPRLGRIASETARRRKSGAAKRRSGGSQLRSRYSGKTEAGDGSFVYFTRRTKTAENSASLANLLADTPLRRPFPLPLHRNTDQPDHPNGLATPETAQRRNGDGPLDRNGRLWANAGAAERLVPPKVAVPRFVCTPHGPGGGPMPNGSTPGLPDSTVGPSQARHQHP